jgi:crotonobetainyl-CoA:carnitine CoA-transferase CaiB-like acyl-CoA transferase
MGGPLAGVRVIDVGTRIAAPFCAGLLGEMGAEVIKVEDPDGGDFMRTIGPFAKVPPGSGSPDGDYSLYWSVEGRGRKSVTLDLRKPEGQDLFRRLAATADIVCENFRPGTLERWNIGPADLDPRLVTVRISVFGQDGPYSQRPGLDRMGIGYGGLMHLTGYPGQPPVRPGVTVSDYLTGAFAASAAVAALYARDARSSGRGAVIDACLYGSVLRILEWTLAGYDNLGVVREREGNRLANSAPLDNYPTADGTFVCVVAGSDTNFRRLCKAMGQPSLAADPRFATLAQRAAAGDELNEMVTAWTSSMTAAEVEAACVATDVPVARVFSSADVFTDPHMAARGDLVTVADPVLGDVRQQAPVPRFDGVVPEAPTGAPTLGQHNDEVWTGLGLSAAELAGLRSAGVV